MRKSVCPWQAFPAKTKGFWVISFDYPGSGGGDTIATGKESTINRALGGSTYPGYKLVRSFLFKKI
jgi:hypothetical protein